MANKNQTSEKVAAVTLEILRNPNSPKDAQTVAASDLARAEGKTKKK